MAAPRQPSFAAGELPPSLWGRTDLERYAKGARYLSNFFVDKHGSAVSRPGTQYLGQACGDQVVPVPGGATTTAGRRVRLIPFHFTDSDSQQNYILEFGDKYFRVWQNGLLINNAYYAGGVVNSTGYIADDLHKLQYAQSLDQLFLACDGYPPAVISRRAADSFSFSEITFDRPAPADFPDARVMEGSFGAVDSTHPARPWAWLVTEIRLDANGNPVESAPVRASGFVWDGTPWNALIIYKRGSVVNTSPPNTFWQSLADGNQGNATTDPAWWRTITNWDNTHTYAAGDYVLVSGFFFQSLQNGNLNHVWTDPAWWTQPAAAGLTTYQTDDYSQLDVAVPLSVDRPITIWLPITAAVAADPNFVTFRVYRGRAKAFGYVGDTAGQFFYDDGRDPDLATPPPQGLNPFQVKRTDGSLIRTESPLSVCFFEDRLTFFGTGQRPSTGFLSAVDDYLNFDRRLIPVDDEALTFRLTSRKWELARWAAGKDKLFVGTSSSVWAIDGSQGPLGPSNIDSHLQVDIGAHWTEPLIVDNSLVFVSGQGNGVHGLQFDFQRGTYNGEDLGFSGQHLLQGHQIVSWCYARSPWGVVWAVREDGVLLSLTYCSDDKLWGWARHDVCRNDNGTKGVVLSVACIPENGEDVVYLALLDQGPINPNGPTPQGNPAWILRFSPRTELDDEALQSIISQGGGLEYYLGTGLGEGSTTVVTPPSGTVAPGSPICLDAWSIATNKTVNGGPDPTLTLNGIGYLNGRSAAYVVADGVISGPWEVAAGALTMTQPVGSNNVYVGLLFTPEFESLDMAEARTKQKVCNELGFEGKSGGIFRAGPDSATTVPHDRPDAGGDLARIPIMGDWTPGGRVFVRMELPLPITIRAITREVETGDL